MSDKPTELLIDKALGAMLGAAFGDALGWPNERRGRSSIRRQKQQTSLLEFRQWSRRSGGRFYPHEETIEAGEYSDDTQLILCLGRSLQFGDQWLQRWTNIELPFWTLYERGGGEATKKAADTWINGKEPWAFDRNPQDIKRYFDAGGNGVAMRVLPHIIHDNKTTKYNTLAKNIFLDGISTHGHPRALAGALAYGYALWKAFQRITPLAYGELVDELILNRKEWSILPDIPNHYQHWRFIADQHFDGYQNIWDLTIQEIENALFICKNELSKGALSIDDDALRSLQCFDSKVNGAGTVAAAAAIFLASRYAPDPLSGVIKAAYSIGADTDTIASMTGGLLGAINGQSWLSSLKDKIQDAEYLIKTAQKLLAAEKQASYSSSSSSGMKTMLREWMDCFIERPDGVKIDIPDGRNGTIVSSPDYVSRSGKYKVQFRKIVCDDGQSLFFSKLTKGLSQPISNAQSVIDEYKYVETKKISYAVKMPVESFEKAIWFYKDILGLNVKKQSQDVTVFEQGLVLVSKKYISSLPIETPLRALIYIQTTDIKRRFALTTKNNIRVITPIGPGGRINTMFFRCFDPDGNIVEVFGAQ